jgi:hypothetical protein
MRSFAFFNILQANRNATLSQDRDRADLGELTNLPKMIAIS